MATTFERTMSKDDEMKGRGVAHHLKPQVIIEPVNEIRSGELQAAKTELHLLGKNLKEAMFSVGIADFTLMDVLGYLVRDTMSVLSRRLGKRFLDMTGKPLTDSAMMRILTAHAIMASYPVSAHEYFSGVDSNPPMFLYLDGMCDHNEYAALLSLLEHVDVPSGSNFAPVYCESLLLTEMLEAMVKTNASLLATQADANGGIHLVIDDHQFAGRSPRLSGSGLNPKTNDKKSATFGPSFDLPSTRFVRFVVGAWLSRKCDPRKGESGLLDLLKAVLRYSGRADFKGSTLYFDRGYDLAAVARSMKFDFVATCKKGYHANPDVPLTYELAASTSAKNKEWMLEMPLAGPTECVWIDRENSKGHTYFLGYRPPGKSLVVIMQTSRASLVHRFVIPDAGVVDVDAVDDEEEFEEDWDEKEDEEEDGGGNGNDGERSGGEKASGGGPASSSLHQQSPPFLSGLPGICVTLSEAQEGMVKEAIQRELAGTRQVVPSQGAQRGLWIASRVGSITSTGLDTILRSHVHHLLAEKLSGVTSDVMLCGELRSERITSFTRGIEDNVARKAVEGEWESVRTKLVAVNTEAEKRAILKEVVQPHRKYVEYLADLGHMRLEVSKAMAAIRGTSVDTASEAQLRAAAKELKVKDQETIKVVNELREAVKKARNARVAELQEPLVDAMMVPWGARPFTSTEAMVIGSLGEAAIRPVTRKILVSLGEQLARDERTHKLHFVSEVEDQGLRTSLTSGYCMTSLDGVFAHGTISRPKNANDLAVSFVEYKMLSGTKALDEIRGIVQKTGAYVEVHFKLEASEAERDNMYAAFGSARSADMIQLIHHLAVSGLGGYYILSEAMTGQVLRVVRATMEPAMRDRHLKTLHLIGSYFFPRTFDPSVKLNAAAGLTQDQVEHLFQRRDVVVNAKVSPTANSLIPLIVYEWNRSKSAVDAMSRTTHNMRVGTSRPGTHRKIIVELLDICIHNAVRLTHVLRVLPSLSTVSSVEELMRKVRGEVSVGQFIREECVAKMERDRREPGPTTPTRSTSSGAARGGKLAFGVDPDDEVWRENVAMSIGAIRGSIKRAEAWNSDQLAKLRRYSIGGTWMNHTVDNVAHSERQRCILCCQECGNRGSQSHSCVSREAPLTSARCTLCREFLCTKARPDLWGPGRSCWEVFHSDQELPLHPYVGYTPPTASAVKRTRLDSGEDKEGSAVKRARGGVMNALSTAGNNRVHLSPAAMKVAIARARDMERQNSDSAIKKAMDKARKKRRRENKYGSTAKKLFKKNT